jgi:2',3'-cyclic-nucleotide 2'-phosphodiesterase (5'-nucleotidase family)
MAPAVIFHTADLHNRLSPAAARQLAELKRSRPGALLLDAGDAVGAGNLTFRLRGEPILRRMAEIGYDAMAIGNRESHPKRAVLERKLRDATFPVLAANMVARGAPLPPMVRSHAVFETPAGVRVGVIGLAPQMTRPDSVWSRVVDYVFEDPVGAARREAGELRERADLVICLSHCGGEIDHELARTPEVDLVLGGHSHRDYVTQESGQALVAHPGHHGSHVACTELTRREDANCVLRPLESGL